MSAPPIDRIDRVEPAVDLLGTLFVPRDGLLLQANLPSLLRDWAGICYLPPDSTCNNAYEVVRGTPPREADLTGEQRTLCLQVPDSVGSFIGPLAEKAAGGGATPLLMAQAMERFLQTSYTYGRGYPLPSGEPLQGFLEGHVPAHCELFATSMVMMLRTKAIPSRYVTGFMVGEHNEAGDYFPVREETAHAWVEAWIPPLGWVQFDPTPPTGRPQIRQTSRWKQWVDVLFSLMQRWRNRLVHPDWRALLSGLLKSMQQLGVWLMESPWRLGFLGLLLLVDVLRRSDTRGARWWQRLWRRRRSSGETGNPLENRLAESLARFDAVMEDGGQPRPPHATLREFSHALRQEGQLSDERREIAGRFLDAYEQARYATHAPTDAQVEAVETLCEALERKSPVRGR